MAMIVRWLEIINTENELTVTHTHTHTQKIEVKEGIKPSENECRRELKTITMVRMFVMIDKRANNQTEKNRKKNQRKKGGS